MALKYCTPQEMASENIVGGLKPIKTIDSAPESACEVCAKTKTRSLYSLDICGPMIKVFSGGAKHFVTFIRDMFLCIF